MHEESHEFQVSAREVEYLRQLASHDESLADLLGWSGNQDNHSTTIRLERAETERLRTYLTVQLATVGFDDSYSLNEEGEMLENLIDRFYIR